MCVLQFEDFIIEPQRRNEMAVTWKKFAYEDDVITKALLTTEGDIIYASGASTPARLGIGSNDDVLTLAAGIPSWAPPAAPASHNTSHENGGGDEISVAGLSGELADDQPPKAHATDHKDGGGDEILLHELGEPTGPVDFNDQQIEDAVVHNVADAAALAGLDAVIGKIAFQVDELAFYGCTVAA